MIGMGWLCRLVISGTTSLRTFNDILEVLQAEGVTEEWSRDKRNGRVLYPHYFRVKNKNSEPLIIVGRIYTTLAHSKASVSMRSAGLSYTFARYDQDNLMVERIVDLDGRFEIGNIFEDQPIASLTDMNKAARSTNGLANLHTRLRHLRRVTTEPLIILESAREILALSSNGKEK